MIRVLIADDHGVIRDGLGRLGGLQRDPRQAEIVRLNRNLDVLSVRLAAVERRGEHAEPADGADSKRRKRRDSQADTTPPEDAFDD